MTFSNLSRGSGVVESRIRHMVKSIELLEFLATRMQSIDKVLNVRMKMAGKRVEMHELLHAFKFANVDGVRDVTKARPVAIDISTFQGEEFSAHISSISTFRQFHEAVLAIKLGVHFHAGGKNGSQVVEGNHFVLS